jgi:UDP-N-acetylglucosamine 3-dehydrogenase
VKPLNIAMVGTGLMAEIYADILVQRGDCRLVAVSGNTDKSTERFASRYNIPGYAGGDAETLYSHHPETEVTIITTPEWVREIPLAAAIRHRQHVLLEKPFAHDYATAQVLAKMLDGYKQVFDICHVLRYSPRFHALQQVIRRNEIGDIRHIYARRNSNRKRVMRVLGKTDLAFWLTPHDIDIMRWLTGSKVVEVFARARNGLKTEDDYLIANLRFADGTDAVLEISWCTPPLSNIAPEARFEVWGTKGSAELADSDMNLRVFAEDSRVSSPDTYEDYLIHGLRQGFFKNMIDCFVDRVKRRDTQGNTIADAVEPIRVCEMIRCSIDEGRVVTL